MKFTLKQAAEFLNVPVGRIYKGVQEKMIQVTPGLRPSISSEELARVKRGLKDKSLQWPERKPRTTPIAEILPEKAYLVSDLSRAINVNMTSLLSSLRKSGQSWMLDGRVWAKGQAALDYRSARAARAEKKKAQPTIQPTVAQPDTVHKMLEHITRQLDLLVKELTTSK